MPDRRSAATPAGAAPTPRKPVAQKPAPPTPRALAGRPTPASRVRPVDWTAVPGRRPEVEPPAEAETPSAPLPAGRTRTRRRTIEVPRPLPAPPPEAVHTLDADDERPLPRPLRIREENIRTVGPGAVDAERVVHTVADPEDAWTADAGTSDHFLRGDLVVQVRRADNTVIGVFPTRYALAVRPSEYEPALDVAESAAGPGARGGRGTRHPTSRRELMVRMRAAGFVIVPGSTHYRVSHPDHPGLFVPLASTPSDRRYTRHAVTQIRRVFGIDLRR
ncbi:hypothetical protein M3F63_08955 [Brachybacterium muris]|uniref:hypothetical protein n=1 Tax=Brachybacterium muris TaxID=219301 RepID=UPI00223A6A67|nr:hypothetical protein [Brachybacterium muris]MCT2177789.1 hypothetical protein [Brachybacterium muris]